MNMVTIQMKESDDIESQEGGFVLKNYWWAFCFIPLFFFGAYTHCLA